MKFFKIYILLVLSICITNSITCSENKTKKEIWQKKLDMLIEHFGEKEIIEYLDRCSIHFLNLKIAKNVSGISHSRSEIQNLRSQLEFDPHASYNSPLLYKLPYGSINDTQRFLGNIAFKEQEVEKERKYANDLKKLKLKYESLVIGN